MYRSLLNESVIRALISVTLSADYDKQNQRAEKHGTSFEPCRVSDVVFLIDIRSRGLYIGLLFTTTKSFKVSEE